jgi:hypothetical protein
MKMKAYESFDAYLKGQSPKNQTIIRALRQFVKRSQPGLRETARPTMSSSDSFAGLP